MAATNGGTGAPEGTTAGERAQRNRYRGEAALGRGLRWRRQPGVALGSGAGLG